MATTVNAYSQASTNARSGSDVPLALVLAMVFASATFAWTTPNHYPPWLSFHSELAMAAAMLLAGAYVFWKSRRRPDGVPAVALLTLAAGLIPAAQLLGGLIDYAGDAWLCSLYLVGFALAQMAGSRAAVNWSGARVVEVLQWIVVAGALLSTWIALYQWQRLTYLGILVIDISGGTRPYANLIQPNQLATLLVLGVVAAAFLYDQRRVGAAVSLLLVAFLGFALAMTQSRAGILEVVVVGAMLIAGRRVLTQRLTWPQVLIGVAVVLSMPFVWEAVRHWAPFETGRDSLDLNSAGVRLTHWAEMIDAIGRQPWIGYGWNQVGAAQLAVAPDHPATGEILAQSHNLILDLLVWNGIPIGLALSAGLAWWFWAAWRGLKNSAALLAFASVVAVFVHAMLEYPLHYAYFLLPVGFLMGIVSAESMPRAVLRAPRWLALVVLGAALGAVVATASEYFRLEDDVRRLRFEQALPGTKARPGADVVILTQLGHFLNFARTPEREGMTAAELDAMATVVRRFPSMENMVRYAAALAINEEPAEASKTLRWVCKLNPPDSCEAMKALWSALGRRRLPIAQVPWPVAD